MMKKIQDAKRFRQIIRIFAKYGYSYVLDKNQNIGFISYLKRDEKLSALSTPEKIRKMFEELGVSFVKLGQMMSTRADLVGEKIAKELEKLQDDVAPFGFAIAEKQIESELKKPISKLFKSFDKTPIASASIGQVYGAVLKNKKKVIVKVQRPKIKEEIESDLRLIYYLTSIVQKHTFSKYGDLKTLVEEFDRYIHKELNYIVEGKNADIFRYNFLNDKDIFVPEIIWTHTTEYILTMDFIEGEKLKDLFNDQRKYKFHINKKRIAKLQARAFFEQVYMHGFFNADPHPSNLYILPNNKLALLDFGMTGRFSQPVLNDISNLFIFIISGDIENLVRQFMNMHIITVDADIAALKNDIYDLKDYYYNIALKNIKMGQFIQDLFCIFFKYRLKIPRDLYFFVRGLVLVEANGEKLDSNFNTIDECKPFIKEIIKKKVSPKRLRDRLKNALFDAEYILDEFPESLRNFVDNFGKKGLSINIEHKNLEVVANEMERVTNRISFALIISAIIVASALIMTIDKGLLLFGFPVLGILGFVFAAFLGFLMLLSLIRRGDIY
ncbi:MAG: AarF/ABC1/UbiB kinase family protein [Candidatus Nanohalarchaeota archaeon]|nr:MAG: AarF/ABC1/UbiB kinase family protein [Candidatus Nanohaloarchaeota archaeon]